MHSFVSSECDGYPIETAEQYATVTLPKIEPTSNVGTETETRLVDQDSGETAKVLISLQDYQADDHAMVSAGETDPQDCVGVQVTDVCINTSDMESIKENNISVENQLIDESHDGREARIEMNCRSDPNPGLGSHPPSLSATDAEKISDIGEKIVESVAEEVNKGDGEKTDAKSEKKKLDETSNPGGTKPKRKRRNDVWLTRVQDADFDERHYKCSFCSAAFFHAHHLQRHEKQLHTSGKEVKTNQCKDCFKTFATQLTLKFHQDFACRMVQRPHRCPSCQLGFKNAVEIESHKCSGNPAKPLCCMNCDFRTGSPRDLEHHNRIHTGERCYKCELCDFRTAWKKNLKVHILKHSGLKPFTCNVCDFATNDRSNLRTHLRKHLKKNSASLCHTCGTNFSDPQALASHMLLHNYDTPYKCTYCNYSTKYKFTLKSHMRAHNVEIETAKTSQIVSTDADLGSIQDVREISIQTADADYEELVEKQFFMCQECGFVIDNRKLFDIHQCKVNDPTAPSVLDGEMIIQIIESPAELQEVVEP